MNKYILIFVSIGVILIGATITYFTISGRVPSTGDKLAYTHTQEVEVFEYSPEPGAYTGYKFCDSSNCTVVGVKNDESAAKKIGDKYKLNYNTLGECTAAAGTTYCKVEGDYNLSNW